MLCGSDCRFLWHCLWTVWFWNRIALEWHCWHWNAWPATTYPLLRLCSADGEIKQSTTVHKSLLFFPNKYFPLWGCITQVNWIAAEVLSYSFIHFLNNNSIKCMLQLYITWCDKTTLQEVTKPRFGSVLPWPLNHIITWQKRGQVVKKLGVLGWRHKTLDEVSVMFYSLIILWG